MKSLLSKDDDGWAIVYLSPEGETAFAMAKWRAYLREGGVR